MKRLVVFTLLLLAVSCGKPDPYDKVRALRREYKLELDLSVSNEKNEATYEIKVQNLGSGAGLHEITVLVELLDRDQQVFWSQTKELDVNGLGSYATKSFPFVDAIEEPEKYEYDRVGLAPDGPDSKFKSYKEFMRVIR